MPTLHIENEPRRIFSILGLLCLAVIGAGVVVTLANFLWGVESLFGVIDFFSLDKEMNFPSFFSFCLMLLASACAFGICDAHRRSSRRDCRYWGGLGGILLFLALDELLRFHEQVTPVVRRVMRDPDSYFASWIVPYGAFSAVVFALYLPFISRLPRDTLRLLLLSGGVYVFGALGFEILAGIFLSQHMVGGFAYAWLTVVEESLEMAGILLFVYALAVHARAHLHISAVRVRPPYLPEPVMSSSEVASPAAASSTDECRTDL